MKRRKVTVNAFVSDVDGKRVAIFEGPIGLDDYPVRSIRAEVHVDEAGSIIHFIPLLAVPYRILPGQKFVIEIEDHGHEKKAETHKINGERDDL